MKYLDPVQLPKTFFLLIVCAFPLTGCASPILMRNPATGQVAQCYSPPPISCAATTIVIVASRVTKGSAGSARLVPLSEASNRYSLPLLASASGRPPDLPDGQIRRSIWLDQLHESGPACPKFDAHKI